MLLSHSGTIQPQGFLWHIINQQRAKCCSTSVNMQLDQTVRCLTKQKSAITCSVGRHGNSQSCFCCSGRRSQMRGSERNEPRKSRSRSGLFSRQRMHFHGFDAGKGGTSVLQPVGLSSVTFKEEQDKKAVDLVDATFAGQQPRKQL